MADVGPTKRISWDKDRAAQLWKSGVSASKIAEIIGGTTKNSVMGYLWRARIARPGKPAKTAKPTRAPRPKQVTPEKKIKNEEPKLVAQTFKVYGLNDVVVSMHKTEEIKGFMICELKENQCRYPISSSGPQKNVHLFCGSQCQKGQLYCSKHSPNLYKRTYVRLPQEPARRPGDIVR